MIRNHLTGFCMKGRLTAPKQVKLALGLAQCCISYRNQLLICTANQMTGSYMKHNTGLKWVKWIQSMSYLLDLIDLMKVHLKFGILRFQVYHQVELPEVQIESKKPIIIQ